MIMADKGSEKNRKKGMDIFSECLASMIYSNEEILETMSPEDAAEFIELRDNVLPAEPSHEIFVGGYGTEDETPMPLAAEENETYE